MLSQQRRLTPRQAEILDLVAEGLGDKEVARKLGISTNTVRTHLQRVYRHQQVPNRAAAASIRVEERVQSLPSRDVSRSATVIGTLLAIAALLVGGPRVVGLASALLPEPASTSSAGSPASTRAQAPARPAAGTPSPAGRKPASASSQPAPVAALPVPGAAPALPQPAPGPPAAAPDPAHQELVIVNEERASSSLAPLSWNDCLARVAAGDAAKLSALGSVPPPGGEAADLACGAGQPVEIFTFWSSVDDGAVSRILFANESWRAALLGPHSLFAAAWAPGVNGSYLVIEIV